MKKVKRKKLGRGKAPVVRRKPLRPGDKVTVAASASRFCAYNFGTECVDDLVGPVLIVPNNPYCERGMVKLFHEDKELKNQYEALWFYRRHLVDVVPESKLAHDYYTMITGGLDAILSES